MCKISAKKYGIWRYESMVVGSCQSFQFFQQKNTGFLEIIDLCLNLGYRVCITWFILPNYKEISSQKTISN